VTTGCCHAFSDEFKTDGCRRGLERKQKNKEEEIDILGLIHSMKMIR
jgi:hypothetical protein